MPKIKSGLAFDLEGPVVDLERNGHHAAHLKCAEAVGLTLTIDEAIQEIPHFLGGPDEAIAQDLYELGDKKLNPQEIHELKDKLFAEWLKGQKKLPTRAGIFDFLGEVKREGVPMSIGSAIKKKLAYDYVARAGLQEFFPQKMIVTGEDVVHTKPAPDIYLECARRLGVAPKNLIVFEDSGRGVQAGRAAGAHVIGMPVYYTQEVIKKLKDAGAQEIYSGWDKVDLKK
ncbi:MAG: hypothetical protein UV74_C0002G0014 [Candidatus Woesebacteria bacterium GW2011_GWB1_43_14]|uniref:HAD-superfamily hydrolase, subfamily IA, variant 3 n=1 Tax=Candidatus Woesebacteria bacterium GW2011_GWB1_43_14 TaxID=1618578 RepID=A0A0G1DLQ5_9BACT|nr:MAG: hypothetical protein UV51_C0004G0061 [Candidatus Woesebacteria bacterium GW2011_GWC1_42_9]KKS98795.1 MAG: hypothetical protein UV74_C0002G0014 [Candidatus Woesebacteria bacterium GW2011_GWB1_43_14]